VPEKRDPFAVVSAAPHPWDSYLIGPENKLALAAAQALAQGKREGFSPLVVHGPSGVGKSRLLRGLLVEWMQRQPGSAVAYLDAQAFSVACSEAADKIDGADWPALRGRFRSVGLFVLEDLESLGASPLAKDELTHTLDALDAQGATVAVSARSAPNGWPRREWPVRLISRLLGGVTARIDAPSLPSLRQYILHVTGQHGLALESEAVESLILAADGYRTLEGWVARLALVSRLERGQTGRRIHRAKIAFGGDEFPPSHQTPHVLDQQTVTRILAEETYLTRRPVTIDAIAKAVAIQCGIQLGALRGPSRRASVVMARHLAMHLARILVGSSFATIGNYFGGRDPATVRYACKSAASQMKTDPALAATMSTLSLTWSRTTS
jgi:chromosomal replication initiator protein